MSHFVIFGLDKLKSMSDIRGRLNHNFREREILNADPDRLTSNVHLGPATVDNAMAEIEARLPAIVRANGVRVIEMLITASPEAMNAKSPDQQNAFFDDALRFVADKFGAQNIAVATIHRDEMTPHLAAFVVPIDPKGKLNARYFTGGQKEGPEKMRRLHTNLFAAVGKKHGLERGIEGSGATHTSIKKYYAWVQRAEKAAVVAEAILSTQWNLSPLKRAKGEISDEIDKAVRSIPVLQTEIKRQKEDIAVLKRANSRLFKEKEKTMADQVRDIPLPDVLAALGASRDPEQKSLWRSVRGAIEIDPKKPHIFKFKDLSVGGRRAIDLVMAHDGKTMDEAVSWLGAHFKIATPAEIVADAGRAASAAAESYTKHILEACSSKSPPLLTIETDPAIRADIAEFLVEQNGIAPQRIAFAFSNNFLHAAQIGDERCAAFPLFRGQEAKPSRWYLAATSGGYEGVRGQPAPFQFTLTKGETVAREDTIAIFTESPLDVLAILSAFREGRIAKKFKRLVAIATCGIPFDELRQLVRQISRQARAMVAEFVRDDHGRTMSGHFTRALKEEKVEPDNGGYLRLPFPPNCTRWIEAARQAQEWTLAIEKAAEAAERQVVRREAQIERT